MAKNLRFVKLVEQSGNPETIELWEDPGKIPALQKAIKENRILTISHAPTGSKKEFGLVGFHQQPKATYLIFPTKLPKTSDDTTVIGIRYDLLKESEPARPKPVTKQVPTQKPKPAKTEPVAPVIPAKPSKPLPKKYEVIVTKSGFIELKFSVSAMNIAAAESKARKEADAIPFKPRDIKTETKSIVEA
jgi:hypothetical protein